ncbi:uncharacterized protein LOC144145050 [Haemaphysalis longicornis]
MEDLKVKELIEICEELSLDLGRAKRKHAILEIMRKEKVTAEEVNEARVEIKERREREEAEKKELREREEAEKKERREREEAESREHREEAERRERREEAERQERREEAERQERREEAERQEREAVRQLELKRLEFRQGSPAPSVASPTAPANGPRIRDQLPPFVIGEDMAKYLVKFEHVCERNDIERSLWAQNLLALLPGEASDVITCLSKEAFESYDEVKEALLRKYRLSPEAFRQRFRFAKKGNESHIDFAFRLKADLIEWLKGEEAYDDRDKVVECIALEQFYRCVEDDVRLWLQDKLQEVKLNKAAELAEEYYTRRKLHYKAVRVEKAHGKDAFRKKPEEGKQLERRSFRKDSPPTKETVGEGIDESRKSNSDAKQRADAARAFESRKQIICYNCKKEGHIAANCKQKVAFATIRETEKNMRLLEPYMQEINVNGKKCRALRDSAATMDVVHPSLVSPNDCTGECAWIRQVAEEQSVCLPIARVVIEGGFGKLNTEAAVSAALPEHFPYLFSNSSEQLLKEQGKSFFTSLACMALTRSRARKLSQELDTTPASETVKAGEKCSPSCEPTAHSRDRLVEPPAAEADCVTPFGGEAEAAPPCEANDTLSPVSDSWHELIKVDRATFIREQQNDSSIKALLENVKRGAKKKNVSFHEKSGFKDLVESHMKAAQALSKAYYDKTARKRTFEVGNLVMLLRPSKKNKLEVHWEGPAKVVSKLSDTNYEVKLGKRQNKIYHSNLMKPYIQRPAVVNIALNAEGEEGADILTSADLKEGTSDLLREQVRLEPSLSEAQKKDLEKIIFEFEDVFSDRPGKTTIIEHDIELTRDEPVRSKPYRCSPVQKQIMADEIKRMCDLGVIVPSESDCTSPLILVQVPGKDPRPCVDYRRLNAITRDQTYPIPNLEERVETVSKANYISTLDLVRGYWQVPLSERASRYAAFVSPFGTFRPVMLSFGLKNAPYCFSKLMDHVLRGLSEYALPYLDDVAIFSNTWEEHVEHLRVVLSRLKEAGLTVKPSKCHLGCAEVTYLGHVVGRGRRRPSEIKVAAVLNYRRPTTKSEIRAFLGDVMGVWVSEKSGRGGGGGGGGGGGVG